MLTLTDYNYEKFDQIYSECENSISPKPKPFTIPESHRILANLCKMYDPKNYLEIGAQQGFAASVVASFTTDCYLTIFDYPGHGYGGFTGSEIHLANNLKHFAPGRHRIFIEDSQGFMTILTIIDNGPYDLIYIDGDHSYNGAKSDMETSLKCLTKHGIIVLDDTNHLTHRDDLQRLVNEIQYQYPKSLLFSEYTNGTGCCIFQKIGDLK